MELFEGSLVVFHMDDRRFALPLSAVVRAVRMVEIVPLPAAPEAIAGLINVGGKVVPVFDLRFRFGLPPRATRLDDRLLIAATKRRTVAMIADAVESPRELSQAEMVEFQAADVGTTLVRGAVKLESGLVLIADLEQFLSPEECAGLDLALAGNLK